MLSAIALNSSLWSLATTNYWYLSELLTVLKRSPWYIFGFPTKEISALLVKNIYDGATIGGDDDDEDDGDIDDDDDD